MFEDCIDEVKIIVRDLLVILVGGGYIFVDKNKKLVGVSEFVIFEYFEVVNVIGVVFF